MSIFYRMRRGLMRSVVLLAAFLLSACSILPKSETLAVYPLPPAVLTTARVATDTLAISLRVDTPYSNQLINSQRILVRPAGDNVSAYQGARWSDAGPVIVRDRIVDAFRVLVPGVVVSSDSNRLLSDLILKGDLNEFQVNYDNGAPVVHIQFDAIVVRADNNRAVATQRFDIRQPVQGTQLPEVVKAFGQATDNLSGQLVGWVLEQGGR